MKAGPAGTGLYMVNWPSPTGFKATSSMAVLLETNLSPRIGEFNVGGPIGDINPYVAYNSSGPVDEFLFVYPKLNPDRIFGRLLLNNPAVCGTGWCYRGPEFQISNNPGKYEAVVPRVRSNSCPGAVVDRCFLVGWIDFSAQGGDSQWGKLVGFDGSLGPQGQPLFDSSAVTTQKGKWVGLVNRRGGDTTAWAWADRRGGNSTEEDIYSDWWNIDSPPPPP